jgi:hypothetical protein
MYEDPIPGHLKYEPKVPILILGFIEDYAIIANVDGTVERLHVDVITVDWRYVDGEWHDLNEAAEDEETDTEEEDRVAGEG